MEIRVRIMFGKGKYSIAIFVMSALAALGACLISPHPLRAAEPNWPKGPYKYFVADQSLRDILMEFGRRNHVPVQIGGDVGDNRLRGMLESGSARDFLQAICDRYGLVWYFDGTWLHIDTNWGGIARQEKAAGKSADRLGEANGEQKPGAVKGACLRKARGKIADRIATGASNDSQIEKRPRENVKVFVFRGGN
jgi:type II secretory pathway component GspD/PulD (secretin)